MLGALQTLCAFAGPNRHEPASDIDRRHKAKKEKKKLKDKDREKARDRDKRSKRRGKSPATEATELRSKVQKSTAEHDAPSSSRAARQDPIY